MSQTDKMGCFALKAILACVDSSEKQSCRLFASLLSPKQPEMLEMNLNKMDLLLNRIADEFMQTDIGLSAANQLLETDFISAGIELSPCQSTMGLCDLAVNLHRSLLSKAGYQLLISDEVVTMSFSLEQGAENAYRARCELLIFSIYQLINQVTGLNPMGVITQVCFSFLKPSYYLKYSKLLSCPISYSDQRLAISLDAKVLNAVFDSMKKQGGTSNEIMLSEVSRKRKEAYAHKVNVATRIRLFYQNDPEREIVNKVEMADILGLSVSTLTRKLAQEGTSYMQVVDEIKLLRAQELLAKTEISIDGIANRLGYTSRKGFELAFIRWEAMTPHRYRKRHCKQATSRYLLNQKIDVGTEHIKASYCDIERNVESKLVNS